ncbi:A24 family peptidase [Streptomyces sp. DH37]|uniref:prepilin peptidase n=1 Tax=Streptomyces sp. DH37 TaxID=3040122 RepID=UPI00244362B0|nr:A24 family peptidase [Streptomyces sp. DH37]MDG9703074.1 A24 family peptidase [Streptomyces sp. DH37]
MRLTLIALAAVYGAAAGLLVPRAAYRLAVGPGTPWRAECPGGHPLPGWVGLARCRECRECRGCGEPRKPGTPGTYDASGTYGPGAAAPVAVTAVVCALVAAAVGARPELGVWLLLAPFAVLLAVVDRSVRRLPDVVTLPLAAGSAALLGVAALLPGAGGSWPRALLGGVVLGGAYLVLFLVNPRGMGFGDVKLALPLGVVLGWYGWGTLLAGAFAGFALGAVYGLSLVAVRGAGRKEAMPFGPFMVAGALVGLLLGGPAV